MLREKFKTHEWILLSLYISDPDVDDIETEQSMVVYEVSISGYRQMEGKVKIFHSTSVSQGGASSFLKYFHFVSLYILFHYISGRSIVCQCTKNT